MFNITLIRGGMKVKFNNKVTPTIQETIYIYIYMCNKYSYYCLCTV